MLEDHAVVFLEHSLPSISTKYSKLKLPVGDIWWPEMYDYETDDLGIG